MNMLRVYDQAYAVAREHVAWCRHRGMDVDEVLASIGAGDVAAWGWDDVVAAVAAAWLALPAPANVVRLQPSAVRRVSRGRT